MDQAEQQCFHRQQRRQARQQGRQAPFVQTLFRERHEHRVQRRQGEQAVSQHCHQEVGAKLHGTGVSQQMLRRKQAGQHHRDGRDRQTDHLQAFHAGIEAFDPVEGNGQPEDHRDGDRKAEMHGVARKNLSCQGGAVGQQGDDQAGAFPRGERRSRTVQRGAAPAASP